jgi:glycerol-3-phosphate dehydrogenase subunit B
MFDVLVIGGGLAGTMAALSARRAGARVGLASRSWGATAMSTGALDVAYSPALAPGERTARTITEHVRDIMAHRSHHPYGVLGLERTLAGLRGGYELLAALLAETDLALTPLDLDGENAGHASALGAVLPAAAAFAAHRGLDLTKPVKGRWGVLAFPGDAAFDPSRVIAGVKHDARVLGGSEIELVPVPVETPAQPPLLLAQTLDDDAAADGLAAEVEKRAQGLDGLIAPPVLGLRRSRAVRDKVAKAAGAPVVEALARLPSVPGVRLQRELERAVEKEGASRVGDVAQPLVEDGKLAGVVTRDNLTVRAGAVVLATGKFIAGGIVWRERCAEALFGLPVITDVGMLEDDSPLAVVRDTPVESHPLMTAGVLVNRRLQPLVEGQVAHQNLFAAGMVLGGFASRYALCADGVALATGFWAGREAAAEGMRA